MLALAVTLFFIALIFLWQAWERQRAAGLPTGRVIYADTQKWKPVEGPLYDATLGLTGKPDYLVEVKGKVIPVEVKSSRISHAPYDAHIFQLAAYCLLVHRCFGKRPDYGVLHYPNRTFAIDFTVELETAVLDLLEDMRTGDRRREIHRSHESTSRCSRCGFRNICDQRLM